MNQQQQALVDQAVEKIFYIVGREMTLLTFLERAEAVMNPQVHARLCFDIKGVAELIDIVLLDEQAEEQAKRSLRNLTRLKQVLGSSNRMTDVL